MEANRDFARKFTRSLPDNQLAAMASLVARGIDPPDEHFPIGLQISERARDLGDLLVMLYVAGDEASRARMRAVLRADRTFMERVVRPLASSHQAEEHRGMLARWIVAGDPAAVQPLLDAWHEHRYGPAVCSRLGCETLTYKPASLAPRTEEEAPPRIPGCGRCKLVHYCSTECQAGDWKQHKVFCGKEPPPDRSVLSLPEGWKPVCTRTA
ncbi:hypothetical protein DFJ74DRAFT_679932 [Hyaloraphidium curvatum]|nr:hypothetical protein DFJ74DRAFT_679932 [Hyaloraphidium curvatum]